MSNTDPYGIVPEFERRIGPRHVQAKCPEPGCDVPDDPAIHCWEGSEDGDATCLLRDGHDGPHRFTPDRDITIAFSDDDASAGIEAHARGSTRRMWWLLGIVAVLAIAAILAPVLAAIVEKWRR